MSQIFSSLFSITLVLFLLSAIVNAVAAVTKNRIAALIGSGCIGAAVLASIGAVVLRTVIAARIPVANTYETMLLFSLFIGLGYFALMRSDTGRLIATGISLLNVMLLAFASTQSPEVKPLIPALKSTLLTVHVLLCFFAYAAFGISFITAVIHLFRNDADTGQATYRVILFGFPFLTAGIITGALWAERAWGRYWGWDPKETWALITWLVYAAYLHLRFMRGWKGRKLSIIAAAGFLVVIFTYLGVNYFLAGLHSYR
ncbi:MAG: cytochrome c biogenesis protein CcsA [Spirochaetes bacterium]|nr:cytochrome c biogenesis protein CcsA [Spirochaetota bacterium]